VRTLPAAVLVLALAGCTDRAPASAEHDAGTTTAAIGPDPIVLRVPRSGGIARAYAYPRMDSALWSSAMRAPALARTLGFDAELGTVAYADTSGRPGRIDFRGGGVGTVTRARLASLASADGSTIFGIAGRDTVVRYTPSGTWRFKPPRRPRALFPQPDGSLVVLAEIGDSSVLWQVVPPERTLADTTALPRTGQAARTQVGDRVYFTVDSGLVGVRTRDLSFVPSLRLERPVRALQPTPSGDRLYIVTDSSRELLVFDRYEEDVIEEIALPGEPAELRMDPLGRYVLVRAAGVDSVWVVAIATNRLLATLPSVWRADLPTVAPDGSIALASRSDVRLVSGEGFARERVVRGGAADFWHFLLWNGFRPRAAGLDEPVSFAEAVPSDTLSPDSLAFADSAAVDEFASAPEDAPAPVSPAPPATPRAPRDTAQRPRPRGYFVQLAALLNERAARDLAPQIRVENQVAHVETTVRDGARIYRVVLGPYQTRADAERVGRATGRSFWVNEATP
jgi:cell division septation protein DedD